MKTLRRIICFFRGHRFRWIVRERLFGGYYREFERECSHCSAPGRIRVKRWGKRGAVRSREVITQW